MMLRLTLTLLLVSINATTFAETIRVPRDQSSIQSAVDAAEPGDTVLVSAGTYKERILLKPGIILCSDGVNDLGEKGLLRAEYCILDGGGSDGEMPGITMAEGSTLDGFTITNVGEYDEKKWKYHFDSHGEELEDDDGSVQVEGTTPAVSAQGVNCTIINNIVHHNGDVGIAILGDKARRVTPLIANNISFRNLGGGIGIADLAEPIVRENECSENLRAGIGCRNASPFILANTCFSNIRAGIGCREGAAPIIRGNKCFQNRRAGIGIRMNHTSPIVEGNECFENDMAGIGNRDGATPVIRNNKCYKNRQAGIGCNGSRPLIIGNDCQDNQLAGIGLQGEADAVVLKNSCAENRLVAIGVTQRSKATIAGNKLSRTGGVPPIIAVKEGSVAAISNNDVRGGGVAALLIQGRVNLNNNRFTGTGDKQGNAVWVWQDSRVKIEDNDFEGYRAAVNGTESELVVTENRIRDFQGSAIVVNKNSLPAHVYGNTFYSSDDPTIVIAIQGAEGVVAGNIIKAPEDIEVDK